MRPFQPFGCVLALSILPVAFAQMAGPMPAKSPVKPAAELLVSVNGTHNSFALKDLKALTQTSIIAVDGHTGKSHTFSGPLLADVLARCGLPSTDVAHRAILSSYLQATGTDGYTVVYSAAEIEPLFSTGKVIVALLEDQQPVASGMELVNPLDAKPARWVHGLTAITVTMPAKPSITMPQ